MPLLFSLFGPGPAQAVESVRVPPDAPAIDLTHWVEKYSNQGDRIQVSTAPGPDGIIRRIEVHARDAGAHPSWIVFALTNDTDEQMERLIVAPHFRLVGSGVIWPDLGSERITEITASQGIPPEKEDVDDADVFRITLDPGATVTYVAELKTPKLPQLYLWEPDAYKDKTTDLTLYKGIVIGIAGLLALFLTIVFVVKGAVIFPAAAALAWAVLAYISIDFGFWAKIFGTEVNADRIWRAGAETVLAATLVVFLFAYLNLRRWHVRASHVAVVWIAFLIALVGLAVYDPPIAAGIARISLATTAGVGFILVIYLATHGVERAVMLIPTWLLLVVWVAAAGFIVNGSIANDLASPALLGGLVLLVMLIGFTIMQSAFASGGVAMGAISDVERKALALTGASDIIFDWDVINDRIFVSPEIEEQLGVRRGELEGPASSWLSLLHPLERDRYRTCLDTVLEQRRGRIAQDFRFHASDGHYFWFRLRARPVVGPEGDVVRLVGTLTDVTDQKNAFERLLHDAVHDNLTGLPNREIFFDRLELALLQAEAEADKRPTVLCVDIDRFNRIIQAVGSSAGDSVLLTVARRLGRLLQPRDTLARIAGDTFAVILASAATTEQIVHLADRIRRTVSTPITFANREIPLSVSVGVALYDPQWHPRREDMLKDAEIAMRHAKRDGGGRIEVFRPSMRAQGANRQALESELRRALELDEIKLFFQPIVRLDDRTVAGFEALLRWEHPRLGRVEASEFLPLAEETGLIVDLGLFAIQRTARELAAWQKALDVNPPIFACVDISSRQILRHDLLADVKNVLTRVSVLPGSLKLELNEGLVMENPEYAAQILGRLKELGSGLALTRFGSGYSSLAYLQRFPFDMIRIDRAFVRQDALTNRAAMLRSLVTLAHDFGMEAIADGAENESDVIEFSQIGCEYALGFAFGLPLSAAEARKLVGAAAEPAI
ncbi:EAL domain-containing protein [Rhodoblastus acidophilus]|uniref:EAL domain-containing protein n=1 Tax=Candidatus Rhodoblastus alkanivorans TaxID=2954117 RepID=A0ABS9ZCU1_9HYPH|nr:EAL domain-containing protein [Candidatus Rhodoblastus alkanivorans]MCI4677781.1 EAL domain-containing protein [Candidatus Rhodoblastus alkanivorans]MCI4684721.1 EAL domain-containing protein [Candidatus Rhodoblastus alkanivorans]MDI4642043.1 EAL domain-containing protein [Rhodoblastus acidophilus]